MDDDNPISPVQKPRGFGGVAILWKKQMDNAVTILPDCNTRIQCVSVKTEGKPILLISVYMPTKGKTSTNSEFQECIDQLEEVVSKYEGSQDILIGGDFNEEIHRTLNTERNKICA